MPVCVCVCAAISNVKLKGISAECQRHIVKHDYLIRKYFLPGSCWQPAAQFPCCQLRPLPRPMPLCRYVYTCLTSVCVCVSLLMNFAIALKFVRVFNNLTKSSHLLNKIAFSFGPTTPIPLFYPFSNSALPLQSLFYLTLLLQPRTSRRATAENFACKSHINTEKLTTGSQQEQKGGKGRRAMCWLELPRRAERGSRQEEVACSTGQA